LNCIACAPIAIGYIKRSSPTRTSRHQGRRAAARSLAQQHCKWSRRYVRGKPSSLLEISRTPKSCPHKTPPGLEGFGAERLVQKFDLQISLNAVAHIIFFDI
jgi:hypothetical protein